MQKPTLVAVDTNVVLSLAGEDEDTTDAWESIKKRVPLMKFLVPPTVVEELAFQSQGIGGTVQKKIKEALQRS